MLINKTITKSQNSDSDLGHGSKNNRLVFLMLVLLFCVVLAGCATSQSYSLPEKPPILGPEGWPVGVWENVESKNHIELYEDGTGKYICKGKDVVQGESTHIVWNFIPPKLQITIWITTPEEGELNLSLKISPENRKIMARHRAFKKEKTYFHFTVFSPGTSVLEGIVQYTYEWWNYNKRREWSIDWSGERQTPIKLALVKRTYVEKIPNSIEPKKNVSLPPVALKPSDNKKPSLLRELPTEEPVLMEQQASQPEDNKNVKAEKRKVKKPKKQPQEQPAVQPGDNMSLSLGKVYISDRKTQLTSGNGNSILEAGETVMFQIQFITSKPDSFDSIKVEIYSETQGVATEGFAEVVKGEVPQSETQKEKAESSTKKKIKKPKKPKKNSDNEFTVQQVLRASDDFHGRSAVLRIKAIGNNNCVLYDEKVTIKANPSLPLF